MCTTADKMWMTIWIKHRGINKNTQGNALFMLPFTSVIMGIDLSLHKVEIQFHLLLLILERWSFMSLSFNSLASEVALTGPSSYYENGLNLCNTLQFNGNTVQDNLYTSSYFELNRKLFSLLYRRGN